MDNNQKLLAVFIILVLVLIAGVYLLNQQIVYRNSLLADLNNDKNDFIAVGGEGDIEKNNNYKKSDQIEQSIIIHIAGEIRKPGVYKLQEGARVIDAVRIAAGATEDAKLDNINLASLLIDGQQIMIPAKSDQNAFDGLQADTGKQNQSLSANDRKININQASVSELQQITGIGSVRARDIVAYREKNDGFNNLEELIDVRGIGEKTLAAIKDELTF